MFAARAALMTNAPSTVKGSTYFDGTGDYLTVSDNAVMEFGSSDVTIEMWLKTTTSDFYDTLLARDPSGLALGAFVLLMNPGTSGDISLYAGDYSLFGALMVTSGASVRDNAWHHIAIVRNGSAWNTYIDGVSRASQTWSGSVTDLSAGFNIGRDPYYTREYAGYISNLRVVKGTAVYTSGFTVPTSPLTAISGTSLLTCNNQSGAIVDSSTNNLTITAFGNAGADPTNPFS